LIGLDPAGIETGQEGAVRRRGVMRWAGRRVRWLPGSPVGRRGS